MIRDNANILDEVEDTTSFVVSYKDELGEERDSKDNDYSFQENGEEYELFNKLKKLALDLRNSIVSAQKSESEKLMSISDALRGINFKLIQNHDLFTSTKIEDNKEGKKIFETQSASTHPLNIIEKLTQERDRYKQELDRLMKISSAQKDSEENSVINSLQAELPGQLKNKKSDFNVEKLLLQQIFKDQIKKLKEKHEEESSKFIQQLQEVRRSHSRLQDIIEEYKQASIDKQLSSSIQNQNQHLKEQLKVKQEEIQAQRRRLEELNEQTKRVNLKVHQMDAENADLKKQIQKAFEQNDLKTEQKNKNDEHNEQKIVELTQKINHLQQQLSDKESQINQLRQQLKNAEMTQQIQTDNYQKLKNQNEALLKKKEEEHNQHQLMMAQEKEKLQKLNQRLEQANIQRTKHKEHLQTIIKKLEEQSNQLKKQLQSLLSRQQKVHQDESKNKQLIQRYEQEISLLKKQFLSFKSQAQKSVTMQKICQSIQKYFKALPTKKAKEEFKSHITIFVGPLK